jgi:mRNA interferase RelE/StbE
VTTFLKDDRHGLEQLLAAVDLLAEDPRPSGSAEYGSPDVRRLYVGRYRVLYEVTEATVTVVSSTPAASGNQPEATATPATLDVLRLNLGRRDRQGMFALT